MSISSEDLINFSKNHINCDSEVGYRAIVSRGYYGMYHKTLSILKYYKINKKSCHASLIKYLEDPSLHYNEPFNSKTLKKLSYLLKQEKSSRVCADYELSCKSFTKNYAECSIKTHQRYINIINNICL